MTAESDHPDLMITRARTQIERFDITADSGWHCRGPAVGAGLTWGTWATPGGAATATGTITAPAGDLPRFGLPWCFVITLPWLEREVGQTDFMIGWHRKAGPWA